ncbi:MAG: FecR family protein [Sandaracinus sp.]
MSAHPERSEARHEAFAETLREEAPRMDDLRRARLERRVLARARGAATSQELAASSAEPRVRAWSPRGRAVVGALALAAAALVGFFVRGWMTPGVSDAPRFAVGSAFETREGTLTNGSRIELAADEEGRIEIGDVTAQLREGGALEVRSVDPDDVRLVLDRGTAELAFHPHARGRQHLRVVTPSAEVEVVGTIFTVRVDDAGTSVSVREGTVRVTRPHGSEGEAEAVLVHAGESVRVPRRVTADARGIGGSPSDPALARAETSPVAPLAPVDAPLGGTAPIPDPLAFRAPRGPRPHGTSEALDTVVPSEGASVSAAEPTATIEASAPAEAEPAAPPSAEAHVDLTAVDPALTVAVDGWAAHRPSSREIAAAWHDIDELQAQGQYERSLGLLVRLERYAPSSDQDEALFDRARTVQEALRRPRAARALYSEYVRRFPEGRHLQEVRRRLVALGAPAEGDPVEEPSVATP